MPHVLSGLAPRPRKPEGRTRNRGAGDRPEGITPTGGSAPNEAHTPTSTLVERTHRESPLTAVDSTQSAVGKWQHAAPEGGDTAHAHARNDTPPRPPHPVEECTGPDARRTRPTGTPRPGQRSRSGSGSILDAGRPGPPHQQHHRHHRFYCRCGRAGTPAPPAPAPATHPDHRHTGLRRRQPEPRPTRRPIRRPTRHHHRENTPPHRRCRLQPDSSRPGPGREPPANCNLAVADRLQLNRRPARPQPATSGCHPPFHR